MMKKELTVLSLNTFGIPFHPHRILRTILRNNVRMRYRLIAEEVQRVNPDIILFQEVIDYAHYLFLRKHLPMYRYVAMKRMIYGPRGGLLILSRSPLEQVSYEDFRKSGSYRDKSIVGMVNRRGILSAKVASLPLWIINTHLTQNSDHDWSANNRYLPYLLSQLDQLNQFIKDVKKRSSYILGGDFNMPKDTHIYDQFISESKVHDVFEKDYFPTYHEHFLPRGARVGRLDYLFYGGNMKIRNSSYIFQKPVTVNGKKLYVSDHLGLIATFSL